ncbi:MAG: hypothetical protein U0636_11045 [Phycisphaerales bacterium]
MAAPARPAAASSALAAAAAAWCSLAGCTQHTTVLNTRHSLPSDVQPGQKHTIFLDDRLNPTRAPLVEVGATLRMDHDGTTLPVVSPNGLHVAVQTSTDASLMVRLGDPLPAKGVRTRIEAVSLDAGTLGMPEGNLEGAWLLGRAATDDGYLVERPRPDGSRDILLAPWSGAQPVPLVVNGRTNAFATWAQDGSLAWCQRPPEAGDWRIVVRRKGQERVLDAPAGQRWLFPMFAGDGTGIFALRLEGGALALAWLPYEADGFPVIVGRSLDAQPISLAATYPMAAACAEPEGGMAASPPGSDHVVVFHPNLGRAVAWTPGGVLEPLAEHSLAAAVLDPDAVLVTTPEMLGRQQLADSQQRLEMMADGPWLARPTTAAQSLVVLIRARDGRVEIAPLNLTQKPAAR